MSDSEVIATLAGVPDRLRAIIAMLGPKGLVWSPAADAWSARALIDHIMASDRVLVPRILLILTRPDAPLTMIDERLLAMVITRAKLSIAVQLRRYATGRTELIGILRSLTSDEWETVGLHEKAGPMSIRTIARHTAVHEVEHIAQLEQMTTAFRHARQA